MKAGRTKLEVGTKVILQNIKGEDEELNGLTVSVTHPFGFGKTKRGWVGVLLNGNKENLPYGGQCNVKVSQCKIL